MNKSGLVPVEVPAVVLMVTLVGSSSHIPPRPALMLDSRLSVAPEVSIKPPFWLLISVVCCEALRLVA